MMTKLLNFLFPKTIAAIRHKSYMAGRSDMAQIYFDHIRSYNKEAAK